MRYRYPGVQTFTRDNGALFFGRKNDEERLYKLARLEKTVVLYGKSGYGKSSLLQAAVMPRLERETDFVTVPVRFHAFKAPSESSPTPLQRTFSALTERIGPYISDALAGAYLDKLLPGENSLWYHLKKAQATTGRKRFVLVFDQFEEIFGYPETAVLQWRAQLADLLFSQIPQHIRNAYDNAPEPPEETETEHFFDDLELRVVFSIRSDYIHLLNRLKDFLPQILRHCYELDALSLEQAKDAIVQPAMFTFSEDEAYITPAFSYTLESLEVLLRYLSKDGKEKIESFQLQLICRHIEEKFVRAKGIREIKATLFGATESQRIQYLQEVNRNYYTSCIEQLPSNLQKVARLIVENELVTPEDKRRITADAGMLVSRYRVQGASSELLESLKNTYLLRAEAGTRGVAYELSHDALVEPILNARAERETVEAKKERDRALREAEQKAETETRRRRWAVLLATISLLASFVAIWLYQKAEKNLALANEREEQRLEEERAKKQTQMIILKQEIEIYSTAGEYQMALERAEAARKIDNTQAWVLDSIHAFKLRLSQ